MECFCHVSYMECFCQEIFHFFFNLATLATIFSQRSELLSLLFLTNHKDPCSNPYRLFNCFGLFISSNEGVTLRRPLTKVHMHLPTSIGPVCVMVMHNCVPIMIVSHWRTTMIGPSDASQIVSHVAPSIFHFSSSWVVMKLNNAHGMRQILIEDCCIYHPFVVCQFVPKLSFIQLFSLATWHPLECCLLLLITLS